MSRRVRTNNLLVTINTLRQKTYLTLDSSCGLPKYEGAGLACAGNVRKGVGSKRHNARIAIPQILWGR